MVDFKKLLQRKEPSPTTYKPTRYDIHQSTIQEYLQMSQFDPASFLDATVTEASVKRKPLPAGRDFVGVIGEPKSRAWKSNKDPSNPKEGIAIDLPVEFEIASLPPDVQALFANSEGVVAGKIVIMDGIMLDLTANGAIDLAPGKNSKLRRYREATDLNTPGQPFSARMFQGRLVRCKIKHDPYDGEIYDKIDSVAKP